MIPYVILGLRAPGLILCHLTKLDEAVKLKHLPQLRIYPFAATYFQHLEHVHCIPAFDILFSFHGN